jgi:hypothetical protein
MIVTRLGGPEKLVDLVMSMIKRQIAEWNSRGPSWKVDKGDRDREEMTSEAIWTVSNCLGVGGVRGEVMKRREGVEGLIVCLVNLSLSPS